MSFTRAACLVAGATSLLIFTACTSHADAPPTPSRNVGFDRSAAVARIEARWAEKKAWDERYGERFSTLKKRQKAGEELEQEIKALGKPRAFTDLEDDALQIIDTDPTDAAAFRAIVTVLRNNSARPGNVDQWADSASGRLNARMAQLLLDYHLNRPDLLDAVFYPSFGDPAQTLDYWQKIFSSNAVHEVRGAAADSLMNEYFNHSNEPGLSQEERQNLRRYVLRYADIIRKDFADVGSLPGKAQATVSALSYSVGATLPDIEVPTLAGGSDSLAHYRGKVVLLDFWATWCAWCRKGHPELVALKNEMAGRPFEIIGISADENPEVVTRYLAKEIDLPWPQWYVGPTGPLLKAWGVDAYPMYLLVDAKGVVQARGSGGPSFDSVKDYVHRLVSQVQMKQALSKNRQGEG
jgi:thiol-disulfide isomerase/thioredoxin